MQNTNMDLEFEARKALIDVIQERLTDQSNREELRKLFQIRPLPFRQHWTDDHFEKIAKVINNYLEKEARKSEICVIDYKVDTEDGVKDEFVISAEIRGVRLKKRYKSKGKYYLKFIAGETLRKAWRSVERGPGQVETGSPTWNILALFLNGFDRSDVDGYDGYGDWESQFSLKNQENRKEQPNQLLGKKDKQYKKYIEEIYQKIKEHHVWRIYLSKLQNLFSDIGNSVSNNGPKKPLCLTFFGADGTTKSELVREVLSRYLVFIGRIEKNQVIKKHADWGFKKILDDPHSLARFMTGAKGGILILDGFTSHYSGFPKAIDLIKTIVNSRGYSKTCLILMGHFSETYQLIKRNSLLPFFQKHLQIRFEPLSTNVLINLAENYFKSKGKYTMTIGAKKALIPYFDTLKNLKALKLKLRRLNKIRCRSEECFYNNASEILRLYYSFHLNYKGTKKIREQDIFECPQYRKVFEEYDELTKKYPPNKDFPWG